LSPLQKTTFPVSIQLFMLVQSKVVDSVDASRPSFLYCFFNIYYWTYSRPEYSWNTAHWSL